MATSAQPTTSPGSGSTVARRAPGTYAEQATAAAALVLLGLRYRLGSGIASSATVGDIALILLIPVWLPQVWRYHRAGLLVLTATGAAWSGVVLSVWAKADHRVSSGDRVEAIMLLFEIIGGACLVLWARRVLLLSQIGVWYALGLIAGLFPRHNIAFSTAGWKGGLAVAAGILGLALADRARRHRIAEAAVLALLAGLSILFASRSYFATFALTLLVVIWQMRPQPLSRRASLTWTAALLAGLTVGIYYLGTTLLVNGYLGRGAQQKSIEQIQTAGSLILGGRPELGATIALFRSHPWGFGAGVIANMHDVLVAKQGLAELHYDPNNGYVDKYMFGGQIELHSVTGDMWATYGFPGLLLVAVVAFLVVQGLVRSIATSQGSALLVFLGWWTLWNLMFSPLLSAAPSLLLALGLVLIPRGNAQAGVRPAPGGSDRYRHE